MLIDRYQRQISYLRVSVTDRCNFRCVYCLPPEGVPHLPHASILTYEEIAHVVRLAVGEGITKVRLTGGEPLVRKGVVDLVKTLAAIPGLEDLSLTTNAYLLEQWAIPLAKAGLKRINISLDTLDPDQYNRITRGGSLGQVWRGIMAAEAAGLTPIKLNTVAMKGINSHELIDLANLTLERDWSIRFIELMPVGNQEDWGDGFSSGSERYLPIQEIRRALDPLKMEPVQGSNGSGPAVEFRIPGARGTIGFISPVGDHFCDRCNRLRLTADGCFRPCLLIDREVSIREALRAGEDILPYLQRAIDMKPEGHELAALVSPEKRKMSDIGG